MADNPTKKASAFPVVTASSAADSIPIVRAGVTSRIHPASGGGLDADTVDGYQGATLYLPRGYIDGLICSNAADAGRDITIADGVARDSTNVMPLILAAAITKRIDAGWSAGNNSGGMDTGAFAANTVYYIWLIRKDSNGTIDALFSLSSTAPTMPAGYTYKRRIMSVVTDAAANIIPFRQTGDRVIFTTPISIVGIGAVGATTTQTVNSRVPASMTGIIETNAYHPTNEGRFYVWCDSTNRAIAAASATNYDLILEYYGANGFVRDIPLAANANINYRVSDANVAIGINTLGWIDNRGRDA